MGANLTNRHRIVVSLQDINLLEKRDIFVWGFNASGSFTAKSIYALLINNEVRVSQDLWKIKVPIKIKVFLWYLKKGVILTKDNLDEIGMVTGIVVSVILQNPYNTSF